MDGRVRIPTWFLFCMNSTLQGEATEKDFHQRLQFPRDWLQWLHETFLLP